MNRIALSLCLATIATFTTQTTSFSPPRTIQTLNPTHNINLPIFPPPSSTTLHLTTEGINHLVSNYNDPLLILPSIEVASLLTNENIKVAFSVATFLPQIFWLFLILIVSRCSFGQLLFYIFDRMLCLIFFIGCLYLIFLSFIYSRILVLPRS